MQFALEFPLLEARVPKLVPFLLAVILPFSLAFADEGDHQHGHEMAAGGYGTVHFATSCSAAVQPSFQRAVAMLHSFGYEAARKAFEDVAQRDPKCAPPPTWRTRRRKLL